MSLGSDILNELPFLREQAESMMIDHCVITREGERVFDPATGEYETTITPVYTGKCKVQSQQAQVLTPTTGDHQVSVQEYSVHLPVVESVNVRIDDDVLIDACVLDPQVVEKKFTVSGGLAKTFATARRLSVVEVT